MMATARLCRATAEEGQQLLLARIGVVLAQRVTRTLQQLPREVASVLPYRSVEVLSIQPTQSLDALAQAHAHELPLSVRRALGGLGALKGGGGALASYLLFEPGFVQTLVAAGERDAFARKQELLAFMGHATA